MVSSLKYRDSTGPPVSTEPITRYKKEQLRQEKHQAHPINLKNATQLLVSISIARQTENLVNDW